MKKLAWSDNPTLIRTNQLDFYASGDLFSSKICMLEGFQSKKKEGWFYYVTYFCTGHRKSSAATRIMVTSPASSAAWTAASEVIR